MTAFIPPPGMHLGGRKSGLGGIPGMPSLPDMPTLQGKAGAGALMVLSSTDKVNGERGRKNRGGLDPSAGVVMVPYTGPAAPDRVKHNDPKMVNEINGGEPLRDVTDVSATARTVKISNVAINVTETNLLEWLCCASETAKPVRVKLIQQDGYGKSSKHGFAEFETVEDAHAAIGISGTELCGLPIKICQAKGPIRGGTDIDDMGDAEEEEVKARTVYVSQLDPNLSEAQIKNAFERKCGNNTKVLQVRVCGEIMAQTRYAFVEFDTINGASLARALHGVRLGNNTIRVGASKVNITKTSSAPPESECTTHTIHIGNLDRKLTERQLREHFEDCGEIKTCWIAAGDESQPHMFGFMEFETREAFVKAFDKGGTLLGDHSIRVNYAKTVTHDGSDGRLTTTAGASASVQLGDDYLVAIKDEQKKYNEFKMKEKERASRQKVLQIKDREDKDGDKSPEKRGRGRDRDRDDSRDRRSSRGRKRRRDRSDSVSSRTRRREKRRRRLRGSSTSTDSERRERLARRKREREYEEERRRELERRDREHRRRRRERRRSRRSYSGSDSDSDSYSD